MITNENFSVDTHDKLLLMQHLETSQVEPPTYPNPRVKLSIVYLTLYKSLDRLGLVFGMLSEAPSNPNLYRAPSSTRLDPTLTTHQLSAGASLTTHSQATLKTLIPPEATLHLANSNVCT